jgi:MFS family permease
MTPERGSSKASAPETGPNGTSLPRGATTVVVILTAMNLLNYMDRYAPSAVKDLFKHDLGFTDAQTSYPLSAFVIVYMLTSPVFGALSDRWPRKLLIAFGVGVWSIATGAAAFSVGFWSFLLARAIVGVGEAAYATISPALISDFFPPARRNFVLTFFYVAIPVGSALGFILGGALGTHFGWRYAFMMVGFPGTVAAALILLVRDPGRGTYDTDKSGTPPRWAEALRLLLANREYVVAVLGYAAVTFGSGALADWFATFLYRHRGFSLVEADSFTGTSAVIGGIGGTLAGGLVADRLKGRTRKPYLALCAVSMALATVFAVVALSSETKTEIVVGVYLAQFFLWFYNGPINAIIVNSVSSAIRVRAFALSIFTIHVLGDAISPSVVGTISDVSSLPLAIALVPVALGLGALIWMYGWRTLPESEAPNGCTWGRE